MHYNIKKYLYDINAKTVLPSLSMPCACEHDAKTEARVQPTSGSFCYLLMGEICGH